MKFLGPISKDLTGPGAEELLAQARLLLGQVRNDMRLGGRQQGWGHWDLDAERRMRCYSNQNGAAPIDLIWIETIGEEEELHGWVMEHGFFALDLPALNADPVETTAYVYVPGDIAEAYTNGTELPDDDVAAIVGRLATNEEETGPLEKDGIGMPRWPDGAPVLTNGKHSSYHGAGASDYDYIVGPDPYQMGDIEEIHYKQNVKPSSFTGLARAWAQAMVGAGLNDEKRSERMPAGFSGTPGSLGLVVDSDGYYWACDIGLFGLKMHLLNSGKTTEVIAQWLRENEFPDVDMSLLRAYVLADLTPSDEGTHVVLTAEQLAPAYDDGNASPFQAGWAWSPVGAKAAIVNARGYGDPFSTYAAYESALSEVTITWELSGNPPRLLPKAAVDAGGFYRFRPFWAYHKFWIGDNGSVNMIRCNQNFPGASDCDAVAPVVCWYTKAGELEVWKYYKGYLSTIKRERGDTTDDPHGIFDCSSWSERTGDVDLWAVKGGYGYDGPPAETIIGSGMYNYKELELGGGGESYVSGTFDGYDYQRAQIWDRAVGNQNSQVTPPVGGCGNYYPPGDISGMEYDPALYAAGKQKRLQIEYTGGSGTYTETNETLVNASGAQILVYLGESPDVIWELNNYQYDGRFGTYDTTYQADMPSYVSLNIVACSIYWDGVAGDYPVYGVIEGGVLVSPTLREVLLALPNDTGANRYFIGYQDIVSPGVSRDYGSDIQRSGRVRIAGQTMATFTADDASEMEIACLVDNGLDSCSVHLVAMVSANFNAFYNSFSSAWTEPDPSGIDFSGLSTATSALTWVGGA